jgi:hypothetical protein
LILKRKVLMKAGMAIAELLIDFTAIAVSIVVSLVIPSILPKMPAEFVYFAVGWTTCVVTLTVADLKAQLVKKLRRGEE